MLNKRLYRIGIAFLIACLLQALFSMMEGTFNTASINRILVLLGGNFYGGGYIQMLTFFAFFWGLLEIWYFNKSNKVEKKYFKYELLPTEEFRILGNKEINQIRLKAAEYLRSKTDGEASFFLVRLINKACIKFRANQSVPETLEVVTTQARINMVKAESLHSMIKYLAWAIPSIGFIGTVLGISQALSIANSGEIDEITATLGVAFDTTLLALILSLILMYLIHQLQEETEILHSEIEEYVVDNLVNRIDVD